METIADSRRQTLHLLLLLPLLYPPHRQARGVGPGT